MSCDLLPTDVPGPHYEGDVFDIINDGWDLMIAFPPCTHLALSGSQNNQVNKKRLSQALDAKDFFMRLYNANIEKIALENPTPLQILKMPLPSQAIQPYEFGHPYSKRTLLWLKNLPLLEPTKRVKNYEPFLPSNTGGKKKGQNGIATEYQKIGKRAVQPLKALPKQWPNNGVNLD
jgi:hypothetical protein